jgi:hypothetical protein
MRERRRRHAHDGGGSVHVDDAWVEPAREGGGGGGGGDDAVASGARCLARALRVTASLSRGAALPSPAARDLAATAAALLPLRLAATHMSLPATLAALAALRERAAAGLGRVGGGGGGGGGGGVGVGVGGGGPAGDGAAAAGVVRLELVAEELSALLVRVECASREEALLCALAGAPEGGGEGSIAGLPAADGFADTGGAEGGVASARGVEDGASAGWAGEGAGADGAREGCPASPSAPPPSLPAYCIRGTPAAPLFLSDPQGAAREMDPAALLSGADALAGAVLEAQATLAAHGCAAEEAADWGEDGGTGKEWGGAAKEWGGAAEKEWGGAEPEGAGAVALVAPRAARVARLLPLALAVQRMRQLTVGAVVACASAQAAAAGEGERGGASALPAAPSNDGVARGRGGGGRGAGEDHGVAAPGGDAAAAQFSAGGGAALAMPSSAAAAALLRAAEAVADAAGALLAGRRDATPPTALLRALCAEASLVGSHALLLAAAASAVAVLAAGAPVGGVRALRVAAGAVGEWAREAGLVPAELLAWGDEGGAPASIALPDASGVSVAALDGALRAGAAACAAAGHAWAPPRDEEEGGGGGGRDGPDFGTLAGAPSTEPSAQSPLAPRAGLPRAGLPRAGAPRIGPPRAGPPRAALPFLLHGVCDGLAAVRALRAGLAKGRYRAALHAARGALGEAALARTLPPAAASELAEGEALARGVLQRRAAARRLAAAVGDVSGTGWGDEGRVEGGAAGVAAASPRERLLAAYAAAFSAGLHADAALHGAAVMHEAAARIKVGRLLETAGNGGVGGFKSV